MTLQLQEIADGEIFRFEPAQEGVVVFGGARQVDVIVARNPVLPLLFRPTLQIKRDPAVLARREIELRGRRNEEKSAVGLDAIVTRGQAECRAAIEQKKMRFIVARDFEDLGIRSTSPQPLAVKQIHPERQQRIHRAEPERLIVLE